MHAAGVNRVGQPNAAVLCGRIRICTHGVTTVGAVTAGQPRHNSSNIWGVTAGQVRHNSSQYNCPLGRMVNL